MIRLTSAKNPLLQSIRRAAAAGRPTEEGLVVAEGPHLLQEALRSTWKIEQVFVTTEAQDRYADLLQELNAETIEVSARAFGSMASTGNPQEVLMLLRPRKWDWPDLTAAQSLIVVLDGIQDPGNAGAIVRSAEAFGATGVVFLDGCVRVANGKFLRATAGSIFRVPYLEGIILDDFLRSPHTSRLTLFALSARSQTSVTEADLRNSCAIAVGSEGQGISPRLLSGAQPVSIPILKIESLNAAIACSIALFEARRQRSRP